MPDGIGSDEGFFIATDGKTIRSGKTGGPESSGDGVATVENPSGHATDPETVAGFAETPIATKKRGRPVGSKNKPKTEGTSQDFLGLGNSVNDKEAEVKRRLPEVRETIKARHLMLAMSLGLPELMIPDAKADALAIAWIRFQQEYPATKLSPRVSVVIDLTTAGTLTYLPILAALSQKARNAASAKKQRGFNIPPNNPAMKPQTVDPRQAETKARTGPVGEEFVIASGAPDSGKIKFD